MRNVPLRITYIGGPTALLETAGLRLLTDPTLDAAGAVFETPAYSLRKTQPSALSAEALGSLDAVLLSHDHHFDNLDNAGRAVLGAARIVLTTTAGAERLGNGAIGLEPWQSIDLPTPDGHVLRVTATPARHGPPHADRGPVIGFILAYQEQPDHAIYISGDTVWFEGVEEVSKRYSVEVALLFMGAAKVSAVGPWPLTFTAQDGVMAARAFADAIVVPLHYEGWEHFTESRDDIARAFTAAELGHRLRWLVPGAATDLNEG
jgi:L-ascorbate metabolism protein UlaG (beta-lactamase superfamily)